MGNFRSSGGSIDVTNPGTIDSRGVVDWNIGYWGPFKLELRLFHVTRQLEPQLHQNFIGESNEQLALIAPIGGDDTLPVVLFQLE